MLQFGTLIRHLVENIWSDKICGELDVAHIHEASADQMSEVIHICNLRRRQSIDSRKRLELQKMANLMDIILNFT